MENEIRLYANCVFPEPMKLSPLYSFMLDKVVNLHLSLVVKDRHFKRCLFHTQPQYNHLLPMNLEACGMFQIKSFLNSTLIRANKAQPLPLTMVTTSLPASIKEM